MMDQVFKRRVRRLWQKQCLLSVGALTLLGVSVLQLQAVLKYRPQQPAWTVELSQHVEIAIGRDIADNDRTLAIIEIREIAEERRLRATEYQALALVPSRDQVQAQALARVLAQRQGLSQSLDRVQAQALDQVRTQSLSQDLAYVLRLLIEEELDSVHGLELQQGHFLDGESNPAAFRKASVLLGISVFFLLAQLVLLARSRDLWMLPANAHFIAFLPEDCVANLASLRLRMRKKKVSPWKVRLRILEEFLHLIWVFYIQVRLENLTLPSGNHKTDD